jgi:hypothetical protein
MNAARVPMPIMGGERAFCDDIGLGKEILF